MALFYRALDAGAANEAETEMRPASGDGVISIYARSVRNERQPVDPRRSRANDNFGYERCSRIGWGMGESLLI